MNKKTPQKKICRSYATCPDHTCGSCNVNPYAAANGPTLFDGAGNPLPTNELMNSRTNELLPVTPEVLPPENKAITQSGNNAILTSHSPGDVTTQYRRAIAGTLEMLRFGAMLAEIDHDLSRSTRKGCIQEGDTLKAWLEEYCPEINYKTAMRFKRLAEGLKREFKIPAKMRLMDALPEADGSKPESTVMFDGARDKVIEIREQIWEFVNGKSARQLMFDFGLAERKPQGGSREGSGRPGLKEVPVQTRAGAAWAKIGHEIDLAVTWKFTRFLPPGIAKEALETVTLLRDLLKERVEEAKQGGSNVSRLKELAEAKRGGSHVK